MKYFAFYVSSILVYSTMVYGSSETQPHANSQIVAVLDETTGGKSTLKNGNDLDYSKDRCIQRCLTSPSCLSYFAGVSENGDDVCRLDVMPYSLPLSKDPYLAFVFPTATFTGVIASAGDTQGSRTLDRLFFGVKVEQGDHLAITIDSQPTTIKACFRACLTNSNCITFEYTALTAEQKSCRLLTHKITSAPVFTNLRFSLDPSLVPHAFTSALGHLPKGQTGNVVSPRKLECLKIMRTTLIPDYLGVVRSLKILSRDETEWLPVAMNSAFNVTTQYLDCLNH